MRASFTTLSGALRRARKTVGRGATTVILGMPPPLGAAGVDAVFQVDQMAEDLPRYARVLTRIGAPPSTGSFARSRWNAPT